jgi:hypothetical protein
MRRRGAGTIFAALGVLVTLSLMAASAARADGDPASDWLLTGKVFVPPEGTYSAADQARFAAVVDAANRAGFTIRVALITSTYDMGSVTALYGKPRAYAKFLAYELSIIYHGRLLIVMPGGFGFEWRGHDSGAAYRLLSRIPIRSGDAGLLAAAQTAVQRLAARADIKVTAPEHVSTPAQRNSRDRLVLITLSLVAVLSVLATRVLLRSRG